MPWRPTSGPFGEEGVPQVPGAGGEGKPSAIVGTLLAGNPLAGPALSGPGAAGAGCSNLHWCSPAPETAVHRGIPGGWLKR